ncbi:ParE-like toxin of type II ParDE toxin-antitoxin system [Vibrio crassostreae]|uniref:Uncharacterized protein n=1 Tax=Vibrio crassostreae TaxID=246167 RepID=A0A822N2T7_9VIBR|nr:ParE-like toxin of type II ParDE toxin-antitoxin system [Vibrio crassostreae]CAK2043947.1 ParE-like toxin of type II ParDE toxin-antitoxin system [Vibrio crassostreae]CAK2044305.1 ParE-like toxin of type II ParDE toxin-antitoxin system [Vibrio crassostreae]CAK2047377.1 ParE-like toxin of type II ParDE toxin-antitoxin system [Vibrio crassostreae]CAK2058701.1 ParE-like toxin of type II ParDE toxin-antitoxin system [Vibrio crassostreae]
MHAKLSGHNLYTISGGNYRITYEIFYQIPIIVIRLSKMLTLLF